MCPVRSVTYVSGRTQGAAPLRGGEFEPNIASEISVKSDSVQPAGHLASSHHEHHGQHTGYRLVCLERRVGAALHGGHEREYARASAGPRSYANGRTDSDRRWEDVARVRGAGTRSPGEVDAAGFSSASPGFAGWHSTDQDGSRAREDPNQVAPLRPAGAQTPACPRVVSIGPIARRAYREARGSSARAASSCCLI